MFDRWRRFLAAWRDYPLPPGTLIGGRYRTQETLGTGSYGTAYRCIDEKEGRIAAVKLSKPSKQAVGRRLLAREREVLSRMAHPFIPACLDYGESGEGCWLVTEFIEGRTLEDLIFGDGASFTEHECLSWTLDLMDRVAHIHEQGYVHLDLRIPNVIIRDNGVHVIDFGLARPVGGGTDAIWLPGREELPERMPPLVQSDLYDVGHLMLFLLYSGYKPEAGQPDLSWEEELELTPAVRGLLRRLLELDRPYASAGELMADLESVRAGLPA